MEKPRRIYGIDFSGAKDAGNKIWIAKGVPVGEGKRKTDTEARTPFSPYNLRLFKQTYHGISGVLFPLVRDGGACVLPFREPVAGKPWILEICPASTLKHLMKKRVPSYKGPKEVHRESRGQLLADVFKERAVFGKNKGIKEMILSDRGGDALDSVIAAVAAFNVIQKGDVFIPDDNGYWKIEGYVNA